MVKVLKLESVRNTSEYNLTFATFLCTFNELRSKRSVMYELLCLPTQLCKNNVKKSSFDHCS